MNQQKVQQILQIENHAQKIRTDALDTAKQLLLDAQAEVQNLREESQRSAEQEAENICAQALSEESSARILSQAKLKGEQKETLAKKNFDKAVDYVLSQLTK
jgi:vacuolar-type H+-ATPase subunit E/Vma4